MKLHFILIKFLLWMPYTIWKLLSFTFDCIDFKIKVKALEGDLIEELKRSEKSLIRWGDGESACLIGNDVYFQKANAYFSKYLLSILVNYNKNAHYFLGMPLYFLKMSRR